MIHGLCFSSTENGGVTRTPWIETLHKMPTRAPCLILMDLRLNDFTSGTFVKIGLAYGTNSDNIMGFQTDATNMYTLDGWTTTTQNPWNVDIFNGSGISGKTLNIPSAARLQSSRGSLLQGHSGGRRDGRGYPRRQTLRRRHTADWRRPRAGRPEVALPARSRLRLQRPAHPQHRAWSR